VFENGKNFRFLALVAGDGKHFEYAVGKLFRDNPSGGEGKLDHQQLNQCHQKKSRFRECKTGPNFFQKQKNAGSTQA